jgi:intracellular septation protein
MTLSPKAKKYVRGVVDFGGLAAFLGAFVFFRTSGMEQQQALMQATWALVAGSAVALAIGFIVERRIAPFPLIGGVAALFFGTLTLVFHDPRMLKIKPTVMNTAFGVILLAGLAMRKNPLKLLMGDSVQMPDEGWRKLTLHYALFFLALAVLNEAVWRTQPDDIWVAFRFPGILILTVLFSFAQVPLMMKYAKTDDPPPPHVE